MRSWGHRSRAEQSGFSADDMVGKPIVAILNTWSDANPCHAHFRLRAEEVKRGVWQAGGFPMEIPLMTLGETFMKPTTMLYRNLLAMEAEEALRSYPADGAVLLGGCDKTVPALIMGATSANLPSDFRPGRTDAARQLARADVWDPEATCGSTGPNAVQAGSTSARGARWKKASPVPSARCMTMGTASTMAAAAEAMGMTLPGGVVDPGT